MVWDAVRWSGQARLDSLNRLGRRLNQDLWGFQSQMHRIGLADTLVSYACWQKSHSTVPVLLSWLHNWSEHSVPEIIVAVRRATILYSELKLGSCALSINQTIWPSSVIAACHWWEPGFSVLIQKWNSSQITNPAQGLPQLHYRLPKNQQGVPGHSLNTGTPITLHYGYNSAHQSGHSSGPKVCR